MTLNITIASAKGIHQSADIRLSDADTGKFYDSSPKQIILQYFGWNGFISYCGVGKFGNRETSDSIAEWLRHDTAEKSLEEIIENLKQSGDRWLKQIPKDKRFHTFILCAFVGKGKQRRPQLKVISNYERADGVMSGVIWDRLYDTKAFLKDKEPIVLVTGSGRHAVSIKDRDTLKTAVLSSKAKEDPLFIRRLLAEINQRAAKSEKSKDSVSPTCLVTSFFAHGVGGQEVYGDLQVGFIPHSIQSGFDRASIKLNPVPGEQVKFRSASFAQSHSTR